MAHVSAPVTESIQSLIENLELDDAGRARAALALSLARKIDASQYAKDGSSLGLALRHTKELDRLIRELNDTSNEAKTKLLVRSIFPEGGW